MKYSQTFIKTFRETPKDADSASSSLLTRAGFVDQLSSGIYSILPLGFRSIEKIKDIIRQEMNAIGGQELQMPSIQPKELWLETDRWSKIDPPLFKFKDRHEKDLALGSTHEEVIVDLVRDRVSSFRELPLMLYQIQTKFRNEQRSTGGLLRTREFLMKDAYSFHASEEDFLKTYNQVIEAYKNIFKRVGIEVRLVEAHSGSIGGKKSNEFMVLSPTGEDRIYLCGACDWAVNAEIVKNVEHCPSCGGVVKEDRAIEVGHIFMLGELYSQKMKATFTNMDGKKQNFIMGCYGIGVSRLLAVIAEVNHDEKGIIWPEAVSPIQAYLIDLEGSQGEQIYEMLKKAGIEVLFDDREVSAGVKFSDADLLGVPVRIVISAKTLQENQVEIKYRNQEKSEMVGVDKIIQVFDNEKK